MKDTTKYSKEDLKVFKQTERGLKRLAQSKMKRHVKEPNEPVFEEILDDFRKDYASVVVMKSSNEILKSYVNE